MVSLGEDVGLFTFSDTTEVINNVKSSQEKKTQRQTLANITHELKTPLNTVNFSVDQMMKDTRNEKDTRNLKRMKISTTLMLSLVSDIIDMAQLESGNLDLVHSKFSLENFLDEIK